MSFFWKNPEHSKINKGKKDATYNTETMLPLSEIQKDTVILKDWWLRAVIKVTWLNVDLKAGEDIEVAIEQYKKFLNWLSFPLQILVRNTYLDLTPYIGYVQSNVDTIVNYNLKQQSEEYISFLERINLKQWLIFVKQFYVVIPYYWWMNVEVDSVKRPWRQKMIDVLDSKDSAEKVVQRYRTYLKHADKLTTRCNLE